MANYVKLYDWMAPLPLEERAVYAVVHQLTEHGTGYWGSMKALSQRLNIPKSHCKQAIDHLIQIGAIVPTRETVLHQERKVLRSTEHFAKRLQNYQNP